MPSTKNFNPETDVKLRCTCEHPECDRRSVNQTTLDKLQQVRDLYGKPMTVTSGGRCPHHPNEVHRTVPADHQRSIGVDIYYESEVERNLIGLYGAKVGFTAIAAGKNFIHLGLRPQNHFTSWSY